MALVGAVFNGLRLEGVLSGRVRRDGANATPALVAMIGRSRFAHHLQVVLLQGIALRVSQQAVGACLPRHYVDAWYSCPLSCDVR